MSAEERPWGSFEVLVFGTGYQVKKLVVAPWKRLSLQTHAHRAESWTVVSGAALATRGTETKHLWPGNALQIPKGMVHRLENTTSQPLVVIEVQTGDLIDEADIKRLEDDFGRA